MNIRTEIAETYSKAERVMVALLPRYQASPAVQDYARQVQSILHQLRDIVLTTEVETPSPPPPPPRRRANLPRDSWAELLSRVHAGESRSALAAEYGVTVNAIAMQLARERKGS